MSSLGCRADEPGGSFASLRRAGACALALVERLLRHKGLAAVALSGVEAVWLRHIKTDGLLAAHPAADVFVATDCLSHEVRVV